MTRMTDAIPHRNRPWNFFNSSITNHSRIWVCRYFYPPDPTTTWCPAKNTVAFDHCINTGVEAVQTGLEINGGVCAQCALNKRWYHRITVYRTNYRYSRKPLKGLKTVKHLRWITHQPVRIATDPPWNPPPALATLTLGKSRKSPIRPFDRLWYVSVFVNFCNLISPLSFKSSSAQAVIRHFCSLGYSHTYEVGFKSFQYYFAGQQVLSRLTKIRGQALELRTSTFSSYDTPSNLFFMFQNHPT